MPAQACLAFNEIETASVVGFESFRGRPAPEVGQRCRVYRNLLKPSRFSIMAWSGRYKGLVLGYAKVIALSDIVLKVQAGGLAKAQTTGVRNVHAVADGSLVGISNALPEVAQGRLITYSPFDHERSGQFVKGGCFYDRAAPGVAVHHLPLAWACGSNLIAPAQ